ncbi:alpha/beta hydrolase [Candidatus Saccharibacteria bacterium RAAC3_TM7_1]|nr:alpha/beta hydrolase [Candidatus Saccharibacteria bacterium RAAC3_TM7_1]HCZ28610.1 alpha/beta hydrolase [Candidatus Saccharibacteria bacterium]
MNTLTIQGAAVRYWHYGNPLHPMAVFLHGFRGTHHGFEKIVHELEKNYYCIVPDLPGFGDSDPLDNIHSLENYIDAVHDFIVAVKKHDKVFLVGHSFGSIVASHTAATYPDMVEKLVLINPISAPALKGSKVIGTRLAQFYYWTAKQLPERSAQKLLASKLIVDAMSHSMTISKDKNLRRYIFDQHRQHFSTFASPKVVAEAFATSISNTTMDAAKKLTMPTLVLAAEKDQISSLHSQVAFANTIEHGRLHVIKNVGHLVHYEKATEAAAVIDEFLAAS